jgi:hypothetical protein
MSAPGGGTLSREGCLQGVPGESVTRANPAPFQA